jgi:hypothetical protein
LILSDNCSINDILTATAPPAARALPAVDAPLPPATAPPTSAPPAAHTTSTTPPSMAPPTARPTRRAATQPKRHKYTSAPSSGAEVHATRHAPANGAQFSFTSCPSTNSIFIFIPVLSQDHRCGGASPAGYVNDARYLRGVRLARTQTVSQTLNIESAVPVSVFLLSSSSILYREHTELNCNYVFLVRTTGNDSRLRFPSTKPRGRCG